MTRLQTWGIYNLGMKTKLTKKTLSTNLKHTRTKKKNFTNLKDKKRPHYWPLDDGKFGVLVPKGTISQILLSVVCVSVCVGGCF